MRRASVTGADCEYPGCHRAATHLLWHNEQYRCDYHGMDWRRPADWMDVRDAEKPIAPSPPHQPALDRIAADADESERRGVEWRERALRAERDLNFMEKDRDSWRMLADLTNARAYKNLDALREAQKAHRAEIAAKDEAIGELLELVDRPRRCCLDVGEINELVLEPYEEDGIRDKPKVKRACKKCKAAAGPRHLSIVSPTGLAHLPRVYGGGSGVTECGIDATGDGWWWPL